MTERVEHCAPGVTHVADPRRPQLLLAGNPNVGKTTLFNALTGSSAKVSNYPGITVEKRAGVLPLPDLPLARETQPGAIRNPRRDTDAQRIFLFGRPRAPAFVAWRGDDFARASTMRACAGHGEEALLMADLAPAAAGRAGGPFGAGLHPRPPTFGTSFGPGQGDVLLYSAGRLFEGDFELQGQVAALRIMGPRAARTAEEVAEPEIETEEIAQDVLKILEDG